MSERGQAISDGRLPPFSYITHDAYDAIVGYIQTYAERRKENPDLPAAELRTAIAMYIGIAVLLSREEKGGRECIRTRKEIGVWGGLSETNVSRYAEHLAGAGVLEHELQPERGQNVYLWRLVEPLVQAPLHDGEAVANPHPNAPLHGGEAHSRAPHDGGAPLHGGEAPLHGGEATNNRRKKTKKTPPKVPLIDELCDLWRRCMGLPADTPISDKARRAITGRINDKIPESELRNAILGCQNSDWHMKRGKHARRDGAVRNELSLIFRDPESVREFCDLAGPNPSPSNRTEGHVSLADTQIVESPAAKEVWEEALPIIRKSLPTSTFGMWIEPLLPYGEADGILVVVDSSGQAEWANRRYTKLMFEAVRRCVGGDAYSAVQVIDETTLELQAA